MAYYESKHDFITAEHSQTESEGEKKNEEEGEQD